MGQKSFRPARDSDAYTCPHCNVYAHMLHTSVVAWNQYESEFGVTKCHRCGRMQIWRNENLIWPNLVIAPHPHDQMPEDIKPDFEEARQIAIMSPRGAAALLRLVIQKLLPHLGATSPNIDDGIAELVAKGLPVLIQQSLDTVRVIGNEAVHPGVIDLNDTPEIAMSLFLLVNLTIENRIAEPKRVQALFNALPAPKRKGIADRDRKSASVPTP